jgi:membrane protein required for colicin V production
VTSFDIFVAVVLGFSLIFSLMKGFVREIFSLISYVGGYLMAVKYQGTFAQVLMESLPSKPLAKLIAFGGIYIITAIIISLMGKVAKAMLWSGTDLSTFDRLMGGLVGLARGVVIIVAVMFPFQFFPDLAKKFTQDSYTAPYLAKVLDFVNKNPGSLNIRKKLSNFDVEGVKEKFNDLKDLKNLSDKISDLKKNLPSSDQPQDQYSNDDIEKLNDILKSVDKE